MLKKELETHTHGMLERNESIMHSVRITTVERFCLVRICLVSRRRCSRGRRRRDRDYWDDERSFRSTTIRSDQHEKKLESVDLLSRGSISDSFPCSRNATD
jgi:hypothetical protein